MAYIARLVIHRYAMLGVLDEHGYPKQGTSRMEVASGDPHQMAGKLCTECANHTVIRKDGCDFCTACGAVGSCG